MTPVLDGLLFDRAWICTSAGAAVAAVSVAALPGGTSRPCAPWVKQPAVPPTSVAITGRPAAIASIRAWGWPS